MTMRNKLRGKLPFTICAVLVLIAATVFLARLADWQLFHGAEYRRLASRSTGYYVETPPTRGEILDRNGEGIVTNITHYKIVIDKVYADDGSLNGTLLNLMGLLHRTGDKWDDALPIILSDGVFSFQKNADAQLAQLRETLGVGEDITAEDCVSLLCRRYHIEGDYDDADRRALCSVRYHMELTGYSNTNPYTFASDVSRKGVTAVSENTQGVGGIDVQTYLVRGAKSPDLAPHVVGALGAITEDEYKELSHSPKHYTINDTVGKFGVEALFEDELKGEGGTKIIQRNSDGAIVETVETVDAKPGNTVYLTLDAKLQQIAVKSLAQNIRDARTEGITVCKETGKKLQGEDCKSGAVVMLDVSDFSVLAAASCPTYDLNKYSEYGDYYTRLANDKTAPLYNRAFSGTFACGSVFKPVVAMAALEEKIIKPGTKIFCTQKYDYYPTNIVECMHRHGELDLRGALTQSCNYYFAETGRRLGIDTMYLYAEKFGLGGYTGLEIEESRGMLAGRDSSSWMPGNTVQAAIGQSDNAFTPVQLATYAATIANNGVRLKTHIISKITDYERKKVFADYNKAEQLDECGVSAQNLKTVQNDMLSVTQDPSGTANSVFGGYRVKVAAKTGTAENSGSDHSTFICYAPFDKPQVAVAVVLENGVRGKYSMQVAKDLLDGYFSGEKR